MTDILNTIYEGVLEGNRQQVSENVQQAVDERVSVENILNKGLITARAPKEFQDSFL